jgi:hypothetical protein
MIPSPPAADFERAWQSLREVIVHSSGFQTWLHSQSPGELPHDDQELQQMVRLYLEQTLSTLAY